MLNDVDLDNGPLMVIPGSHKGPVLSHNNDGVFCGAIIRMIKILTYQKQ